MRLAGGSGSVIKHSCVAVLSARLLAATHPCASQLVAAIKPQYLAVSTLNITRTGLVFSLPQLKFPHHSSQSDRKTSSIPLEAQSVEQSSTAALIGRPRMLMVPWWRRGHGATPAPLLLIKAARAISSLTGTTTHFDNRDLRQATDADLFIIDGGMRRL